MLPATAPPARSTTANRAVAGSGSASTSDSASAGVYGTGTDVHRWISGSWQSRWTAGASAAVHARRRTRSPVSTQPACHLGLADADGDGRAEVFVHVGTGA